LAKFRIFETEQFAEDLSKDFEGRGGKVKQKLLQYVYPQLRVNPYFGNNIKKLKNYKPETWRYRIGSYRFFYEIEAKEKMVYMTVAEARKDSY
jgi:mRNA interferase RelE/StbE